MYHVRQRWAPTRRRLLLRPAELHTPHPKNVIRTVYKAPGSTHSERVGALMADSSLIAREAEL